MDNERPPAWVGLVPPVPVKRNTAFARIDEFHLVYRERIPAESSRRGFPLLYVAPRDVFQFERRNVLSKQSNENDRPQQTRLLWSTQTVCQRGKVLLTLTRGLHGSRKARHTERIDMSPLTTGGGSQHNNSNKLYRFMTITKGSNQPTILFVLHKVSCTLRTLCAF